MFNEDPAKVGSEPGQIPTALVGGEVGGGSSRSRFFLFVCVFWLKKFLLVGWLKKKMCWFK